MGSNPLAVTFFLIIHTFLQNFCWYSFHLICGMPGSCKSLLTTDGFPRGRSIYALFTHLFGSLYGTSLDSHLHIFSSTNVIQYLNSTLNDLFPQMEKALIHNRSKRSCQPFKDITNTIGILTCSPFECWYSMRQWDNNSLLRTSVTINFLLSNNPRSSVSLLILISMVWMLDLPRGRKWGLS